MVDMVTVYTQKNCPPCSATKRMLDNLGVEHDIIDLTDDPDARAFVVSLGHQATPVVVAGDEHFSGFRPDRLKALVG